MAETNGRGEGGRFAPGNQIAKGNRCHLAELKALQEALYHSVRPEDMVKAVDVLRKQFDHPNPDVARKAIELLWNRLLGRPAQQIQMEVSNTSENLDTLRETLVEKVKQIEAAKQNEAK